MLTLNLPANEKEALEHLVTSIKKVWPLARTMVFGSKATGTADEESDLDVLVGLPCTINSEIRRQIIQMVFERNLEYGCNISPLIVSEQEWENGLLSLLPIHSFVEAEGIPV
jgi:hypothetical protein